MFAKRALATLIGSVFVLLNAAPGLTAEMPRSFHNEYSTKIFGFTIDVTHRLTDLEGEGQRLHFVADTWLASMEEITDFRWDESGRVKPQHYIYKRRGLGKDRDADLTFDWDAGEVTNNVKGQSWEMDVAENIQDKLSYQIQLQKDLIAGKDKLSYHIADGGRVKKYRFEIVGEEVLDTPLGEVNTVKVMRSREDDDRVTYAWMAKDWDYMLVRLQQKEDGDSHTISITKAQLNGKNIERF